MKFNKIFKSVDTTVNFKSPYETNEVSEELNKSWVTWLAQSNKSRDYIYKNLLGAIVKALDYSAPFWTEDITSDQVKYNFKSAIAGYPAASVWCATYKVLGWYAGTDTVLSRYRENTVRQALEKKKSFKDTLSEKANEFERNADIKEHVRIIKLKMDEHANERHFTIHLVEIKPGHTIALGTACGPIYQTFIPKEVEPWVYMKLFTEALIELGFREEDIEKGAGDTDYCYYYNLKVRW